MPLTVRLINSCTGALPAFEEVAGAVSRALALPVVVERWPLDLSRALDRSRRQYSSTALLAQLIDRPGADGERRIAVVDVDLFIPVLTFVFGEAQLDGPAAVVSTWRLDPVAYGLPRDAARLRERLAKEITHELGHTLDLYHCRQFECVMRSSTDVEEIDLKQVVFCPGCRNLLSAGNPAAQQKTHSLFKYNRLGQSGESVLCDCPIGAPVGGHRASVVSGIRKK